MDKTKKQDVVKVLCQNRKARYEYHILETVEAGIVLIGSEIKSITDHRASLDAAYARIENDGVWMVGCNIDPCTNAGAFILDNSKRDRKLLLNKKEISRFSEKMLPKGRTLIPLSLYTKNGWCKVELAVCVGKQAHDKRESIKERDAQREMKNQ